MANTSKELGERLRICRKAYEMTLEDVANELGLNKGTLAKYETGERNPTLNNLQKLASFYKVPTDFLHYGSYSQFLISPDQINSLIRNAEHVDSQEKLQIRQKIILDLTKIKVNKLVEVLNINEHAVLLQMNDWELKNLIGEYNDLYQKISDMSTNEKEQLSNYIEENF